MPAITISAAATSVIGSSEPTPSVVGPRKSLVINLVSGDGYWGWTDTVTAAGATDAGIPLTTGVPIAFDSESLRFNATLRIFSPSGGVVNYQELRHP
jgi:hypothetical protein